MLKNCNSKQQSKNKITQNKSDKINVWCTEASFRRVTWFLTPLTWICTSLGPRCPAGTARYRYPHTVRCLANSLHQNSARLISRRNNLTAWKHHKVTESNGKDEKPPWSPGDSEEETSSQNSSRVWGQDKLRWVKIGKETKATNTVSLVMRGEELGTSV